MALVVAAKFNVTRALHPLKAESPIDSNALELVRTTLERFSQPSNAETPMVFNPATDVNSLSALHPLNVELAIAITPDGRAKETSDSQDLNADAPISVTLVIEVVFNALHELNADSPILVAEENEIDSNFEQPLNAFFPIVVTLSAFTDVKYAQPL